MATLKVIIHDIGMVEVHDTRDDPTDQAEYLKRSKEADTLIAEIQADDSITEKEIEVT